MKTQNKGNATSAAMPPIGARVQVVNDGLGSGFKGMTGTVTSHFQDGPEVVQVKLDRRTQLGSKFAFAPSELKVID